MASSDTDLIALFEAEKDKFYSATHQLDLLYRMVIDLNVRLERARSIKNNTWFMRYNDKLNIVIAMIMNFCHYCQMVNSKMADLENKIEVLPRWWDHGWVNVADEIDGLAQVLYRRRFFGNTQYMRRHNENREC